ncbi:MAG: DUF5615 family PIN-like protein [Pirellulaceae bacterium]|nr:DUF5615 family PIN-like protein [Pirellulaceae bacterium]
MLSFLFDEDFRGAIVTGLQAHYPQIEILRVVDIGLAGSDDDVLLEWAATEGHVLVSHDVNTMSDSANRRLVLGLPISGLILASQSLSIATTIHDLGFAASVCMPDELENSILWLPL